MKNFAIAAGLVLLIATALWFTYDLGMDAGKATCQATQAKADEKPRAAQKAKTQADIERGTQTGTQHERNRVALDQFFNHLEKEQTDAPTNPADACVLPPDRLRLWRAANSGRADQNGTTAQPDGAAAATSTTGVGADARPGSEPHPGGEGLPPAGVTDVPAAGLPADQPSRMPGV